MAPADFAEIIETCRRERVPLGETLVRLKLASTEQVSRALRQQIAGAVEVLRALGDAPTMFLSRDSAWRGHDRSLTFTLDAVTTHLPPARSAPATSNAEALANEVREALPSLQWVAVASASGLIHEEPKGQAEEVPALHRATVADGAHLVLSRNSNRTIVGVALSDEESSLWGSLSSSVSLSEALAVFSRLGVPFPHEPQCPEGAPERHGPPSPPFDALARSLMRDADVWGVVTMSRAGTLGPALARADVSVDELVPRLMARSALLAPTPVDLPAALPVLAVADGSGWWFGAPLGDSIAWILARPSLAAGLGIALLRSMAQELAAVEG